MRSTIALACIVAFASAQFEESTEIYVESQPSTIGKIVDTMVEVNPDTGRYELALPDLPHISVAPVDETTVQEWGSDVEAEYAANDKEWASAWQDYTAAVAQPWNDFISRAQEIGQARDQLDFSNTEDVFRFVTDNVFMDGKSLSETFESEIDEIVEQMYDEGTEQSEEFADLLDKIRAPVSMQKEEERETPPMDGCADGAVYWSDVYHYYYCSEWIQVPSAWGKFRDLVVGRVQDAGFNHDDVANWIEETIGQWEELKARQDAEAAELAMDQTRQAADYAKSVVDEMITNVRSDLSEVMDRDTAEAEFSGYLERIENMRDDMLDKIQHWADQGYDDIVDLSEEAITEAVTEDAIEDAIEDALEDFISFAQVHNESESSNNSNYAYGFGAVALGVAAAAYLYNKKKEQTKIEVSNDADFHLV